MTAALTLRFIERELRNRFAGSFSGGLWALIQPLVQLAVYAYVFVHVFKARAPGSQAPGYVAFLVVALWPWTAFSEALVRATTTIQDNAALIGKVAIPREALVTASVAATFLIHLAGFSATILVLALAGRDVHLAGLVVAIPLFAQLFVLAAGIALACAAVQVFVRDLAHALPQILMLLMFAAPIFYDRSVLGAGARRWLDLHPYTYYAEAFREALLGMGHVSALRAIVMFALAFAVLGIGHFVFRRLDPHFEDFL